MEFIVTGYDGQDAEAPARRQAARDAHLGLAKVNFDNGSLLYATALLDDNDKMIGSVVVCRFESEDELRSEWLNKEPYVTGNVWKDIKVQKCKIPPFILK